MDGTVVAITLGQAESLWHVLWEPLTDARWTDVSGFWLGHMLRIPNCRNVVIFFLPLLLILMCLPRRHLRLGIILTGLAFIGYMFGGAYLFLWLVTCLAFWWLGQRFAIEVKRTDVKAWGPPLAAIGIIAGHFLLVDRLDHVKLPLEWNAWLLAHASWLYPLGSRTVAWEPHWVYGARLLEVLFRDPHDIGAAYLTMRMVSYFSEIKRGTIPVERRSLLNFFAYVCYAPTLIQGPLERYREFNEEIDTCHERRTLPNFALGLGRIVWGIGKAALGWGWLTAVLEKLGMGRLLYMHPEQVPTYAALFFAIHLQVLLLYLMFSGYCDIAIGMSRLLGYRVVENFRQPWLARSLTDMWRRWHISLSFILRDYIFFPLTRRRWNNTLNLLLTFAVCGIWHNLSSKYLLWGLLMGLLVAVNQRWTRWMRSLERHPQRRAAAVRRAALRLRPLPQVAGWLLTINVFVMTGWVCFGGLGAVRIVWELIRRPAEWLLASWHVHLPPLMPGP